MIVTGETLNLKCYAASKMFELDLFIVGDGKSFSEIMLQGNLTIPQTILPDINYEFLAKNYELESVEYLARQIINVVLPKIRKRLLF
jgi:hypothetical protein